VLAHPLLSEAARAGVRLGLGRMRGFLEHLDSPHLQADVVHVAGTNGKGSVVALLSSVLQAHGLRVGALTSPHLQQVNERIRVDGEPIADEDLDALLVELRAACADWLEGEALADDEPPLTYFELMTAAGFVHLARQQVDVALVEVGLGGRLDATNVVRPAATAVVSIATDHTAELGPDLASIAAEKGGIIKEGVPLVLGPLPKDALRVLRAMAFDRGAPQFIADEDYRVASDRSGGLSFSLGDLALPGLQLSLAGAHQHANAGVALALASLLMDHRGARLDPDKVATGLLAARHAGRLEWLAPDLLIDSAHNPAGAASLAGYLRSLPRTRPRTLLMGASNDKDARSMVVALEGLVDRVVTTHCAHPRAMAAGDLAALLVDVGVPVLPGGSVEDALPTTRTGDGLVIVAGSIFLAGAVRELVGPG